MTKHKVTDVPDCNKELGRPGQWRQCRHAAVVTVAKYVGSTLVFLHYCANHSGNR